MDLTLDTTNTKLILLVSIGLARKQLTAQLFEDSKQV